MPTDHLSPRRVAWAIILLGGSACGPTVRPPEPPDGPGGVGDYTPRSTRQGSRAGRQVIIGEMCPQGAAGRPAIAPLMTRQLAWNDNGDEVAALVERGGTPRFTVFGVDGKAGGAFDAMGVADVGMSAPVAIGTYAGASLCTGDAGATNSSSAAVTTRVDSPACTTAMLGCGLAAGEIVRQGDLAVTPKFAVGGACMMGDAIAVDIDGDGAAELFPLAGVLDPVRGPAAEWTAGPTAGATCTPTFTIYDKAIAKPAEPGKGTDGRGSVTLDVLGVVDLDSDGRVELVIALRFPTARTILVYTARDSPVRLELAGEATSFPR